MTIADNIKRLREEKGLMQKEVAAEIGLKPAH
jgi:transcriptional regulator with XRE-family HTH domain